MGAVGVPAAWTLAAAPEESTARRQRHGAGLSSAAGSGPLQPDGTTMSQSAAAYARVLRQLLPTGPAWIIEPDDVRAKALLAMAEELARLDARGDQLIEEMDPRTTLELLGEWERAVGLPDDVVTEIPATITERRIAVLQKLTASGGQSRQYFIDLAATSGFNVTITEYFKDVAAARCGTMRCGLFRVYSTDAAFVWQVNVDLSSPGLAGGLQPSVWFRCGIWRCGERLRSWNGPILEDIIRRYAPAHTTVLFVYG
jgi:uncharacterized protein YmfQ (DUF2313 family)